HACSTETYRASAAKWTRVRMSENAQLTSRSSLHNLRDELRRCGIRTSGFYRGRRFRAKRFENGCAKGFDRKRLPQNRATGIPKRCAYFSVSRIGYREHNASGEFRAVFFNPAIEFRGGK